MGRKRGGMPRFLPGIGANCGLRLRARRTQAPTRKNGPCLSESSGHQSRRNAGPAEGTACRSTSDNVLAAMNKKNEAPGKGAIQSVISRPHSTRLTLGRPIPPPKPRHRDAVADRYGGCQQRSLTDSRNDRTWHPVHGRWAGEHESIRTNPACSSDRPSWRLLARPQERG